MDLSNQRQAIINLIMNLMPTSILDIGCGKGELLKHFQEHTKIHATGIDEHQETIDSLKVMNLDVYQGDIRKLPFADKQFNYAILSNVLHHLPNPKIAMEEALRVAKYGVIASEIWYDQTITAHKNAYDIDLWCKSLHKTIGFYHRMYLNAGEIIALIDDPTISGIDVKYELKAEACDIDFWLDDQQEYLQQLQKSHVLRWELAQLKHQLEDQLICKPGWMIVVISK